MRTLWTEPLRRLAHGLTGALVVWLGTACAQSQVATLPARQPANPPQAAAPQQAERLSTPRNAASQRYEINQTFGGQAYAKDNNVWVYGKDFADLFGMPAKHIEPLEGIVAAAFRIEEAPFLECENGVRGEGCRRIEYCYLDLYVDESKTRLPWASDARHEWLPGYGSIRWLRPSDPTEKPYGLAAPPPPRGTMRNEVSPEPLVAFADPVSKRQATFTSNRYGGADAVATSNAMPVLGYTRDFYRSLSLVGLQPGCETFTKKTVEVSLGARQDSGKPISALHRIVLPEDFVRRINSVIETHRRYSGGFYRRLISAEGSIPSAARSQRYEANQTFAGQPYEKDNNVWAYDKAFADLFGMPVKYIEPLEGVAAVAFRIEDSPYLECGYGGRGETCRRIEYCYLDLYFDENKTPLPWATNARHEWMPRGYSIRWLRPLDIKEKPYGMAAPPTPPGIVRNGISVEPLVAFADSESKRQAIFTTNRDDALGDAESVSRGMAVLGYSRDFYRSLSLVSIQTGCSPFSRKTVNVRLDAKQYIFDKPIARFNRIVLPESFVRRMKQAIEIRRPSNDDFYRRLIPAPGTKPPNATSQANQQ